MKLESRTDNELVAVHSNWLLLVLVPLLLIVGAVLVVIGLIQGSQLWIGGLVCAGIGAVFLLAYRSVRIVCNRRRGKMFISNRGVFGIGKDYEFPFADIQELMLEESFVRKVSHQSEANNGPSIRFFLVVNLRSGRLQQFDVTPAMKSQMGDISTWRFQKHNDLAEQIREIAEFIGVPFRNRVGPTMGEAFDLIRDAINKNKNG